MKINKKWLKSLAVAGVVAMLSANASAEVLAISAAVDSYELGMGSSPVIPGVQSAYFKHAGGPLTAAFTAECAVETPVPPSGGLPPGGGVRRQRSPLSSASEIWREIWCKCWHLPSKPSVSRRASASGPCIQQRVSPACPPACTVSRSSAISQTLAPRQACWVPVLSLFPAEVLIHCR